MRHVIENNVVYGLAKDVFYREYCTKFKDKYIYF